MVHDLSEELLKYKYGKKKIKNVLRLDSEY